MSKTWLAPGKLILIGEYAVLYGYPALVAGIDRFSRVTITPATSAESSFSPQNLANAGFRFLVKDHTEIEYITPVPAMLAFAQKAIEQVIAYLSERDISFKPCDITADTSAFFMNENGNKLGLGSSAAFSVCVLKALMDFNSQPITDPELFALSRQVHFNAQGKQGSGVDIAASVFGSLLIYKMSQAPPDWTKTSVSDHIKMIYIWAGEPASTSDMLNVLNDFQQTAPTRFRDLIDTLGNLSHTGCTAYQNDPNLFFSTISEYFTHMKNLGNEAGINIISESHEHLSRVVKESGAVYKPSGAGGGDLGIAFCKANNYAHVLGFLHEQNIETIDLSISFKGVHSIN